MSTAQDAPEATVPPREDWPDIPPATEAGEVLTELILTTFRLKPGLLLEFDARHGVAARLGSSGIRRLLILLLEPRVLLSGVEEETRLPAVAVDHPRSLVAVLPAQRFEPEILGLDGVGIGADDAFHVLATAVYRSPSQAMEKRMPRRRSTIPKPKIIPGTRF